MTFAIERTGAILSVDLDAVVSNWRALAAISSPAQCAAVVKADAYGLGAMEISQALETAGCRNFFVAHLEEGMAIRRVLATDTRIFVLNGTPWGTHDDFVTAALVPVVNTRKELSQWSRHALAIGKVLPVAVHIDSGMTRLGFTDRDVELAACQRSFSQVSVELILSHLACADQPNHPMNERQRIQFDQLRK
ncbi:MAG: alanine racemase, partial [Nitratireductor sp.]|nr:alanine racemase [Nitratireductor sp.]